MAVDDVLLNIAKTWPAASIAIDGWQHSQVVPDGDSYTSTFAPHVRPASSEKAAYSAVPRVLRLSQAETAFEPRGVQALAC